MKSKMLLVLLALALTIGLSPQKTYAFDIPAAVRHYIGQILGESDINASDSSQRGSEEKLINQEQLNRQKNELKAKKQTERTKVASREGELKIKICEVRKENFEKRKELRPQVATVMNRLFETILKRTEDFYTTKVVPAGGSVANYDALVADTTTKHTAVEMAVQSLKGAAPVFDCTKPVSQDNGLGRNKQLLENVKIAINNYRQSVRALVKAVRIAAGQVFKNKETTGSGSPEIKVNIETHVNQ